MARRWAGISEALSAGSLQVRLESYSKAARAQLARSRPAEQLGLTAAAAAAAVMSASAEAAVFYSGSQNLPLDVECVSYTSSYCLFRGSLALDLDMDGTDDFEIRGFLDSFSAFNINAAALNGGGIAGGFDLKAFQSGSSIGAGEGFTASGGLLRGNYSTQSGNWTPDDSNTFAGVKLDGQLGWIRISLSPFSRDGQATVVDWALESMPGAAIVAGDIPEPSAGALTGLGLLALGSAGVARSRRSRS